MNTIMPFALFEPSAAVRRKILTPPVYHPVTGEYVPEWDDWAPAECGRRLNVPEELLAGQVLLPAQRWQAVLAHDWHWLCRGGEHALFTPGTPPGMGLAGYQSGHMRVCFFDGEPAERMARLRAIDEHLKVVAWFFAEATPAWLVSPP